MRLGVWEILLIILLIMVLFGHSKIPDLAKNIAQGINVFKKELKSKDDAKAAGDKNEAAAKTPQPVKRSAKPASAQPEKTAKKSVKKPSVKKK